MTGECYPTGLRRECGGAILSIDWSDGLCQTISVAALRRACPCATCREISTARESEPLTGTLPIVGGRPNLEIISMEPVGNYAYHIAFSDGHSSGIFTWEQLRSLA